MTLPGGAWSDVPGNRSGEKMRQTWRWFGPKDLCSIDDMLQAGVEGVVSALHHVPTGAVWTPDEIARRQGEIGRRQDGSPSGLAWEVVESLPVSEDIKKQRGHWREHFANYRESLRNLARELGVSQTPIREALSMLEAIGLVTKRHFVGYCSAPQLNRKQIDELYEVRLLLEPYAAKCAADSRFLSVS